MKYIILVGDGMADIPLTELDGKTPLSAANKKGMDYIASKGVCGRVNTVPEGMVPESDTPGLDPWGHPPHTRGYLVGGEGADVGQQGLPELWALVKDGPQLLRWELQDDLEALRLGALTALDEALPHLGILPHLDQAGREQS